MGYIIIELATLIVHNWEMGKLSKFRSRRMLNQNMNHQTPESALNSTDDSFCNNWIVVEDWIIQLKDHDSSPQLREVLGVALEMMAFAPKNRLYMWEAEIDLHDILGPHDNRIPAIIKRALCSPVPRAQKAYPVGKSPNEQPSWIPDLTDTPLHRAARRADRVRVVELWALGWYLFLRDPDGDTPLDILQRSGDNYLCELESKVTELLKASENNNIPTIRNLLYIQGLDPAMVDRHSLSALYMALIFGRARAMNCLLEYNPTFQMVLRDRASGRLPLYIAAQFGFAEGLNRIVKELPDVNVPCRKPDLIDAVLYYRTAIYLAAEYRNFEAAKILIAHGAHLQSRYLDKARGHLTPLHIAVERSDHEMLALLLKAKDAHKCLERRTAWGVTPLLSAVQWNRIASFEVLLQHGASIHAVSSDGHNVVHYLAEYGLHDTLQQHIHEFSEAELTACAGVDTTPLVYAKENGRTEVVKLLKSRLDYLRSSAYTATSDGLGSSLTSGDTFKRLRGFFKDVF